MVAVAAAAVVLYGASAAVVAVAAAIRESYAVRISAICVPVKYGTHAVARAVCVI